MFVRDKGLRGDETWIQVLDYLISSRKSRTTTNSSSKFRFHTASRQCDLASDPYPLCALQSS